LFQTYSTEHKRKQGGIAVATPIKCTCFFGSHEGWGWSESHHINGNDPVGSLLTYVQNFSTLMDNFRRPLLAKDRYMIGVRVAYRGSDGAIRSSAFKFQPAKYPAPCRNRLPSTHA